jgi:hypothetical protein
VEALPVRLAVQPARVAAEVLGHQAAVRLGQAVAVVRDRVDRAGVAVRGHRAAVQPAQVAAAVPVHPAEVQLDRVVARAVPARPVRVQAAMAATIPVHRAKAAALARQAEVQSTLAEVQSILEVALILAAAPILGVATQLRRFRSPARLYSF